MANTIRVFTYGTLMQGYGNHRLLDGSRFDGTDSVKGFDLYDLGPFPGAVEGQGEVYGEAYLVDAWTLDRLDGLEGVPHLYTREWVTLESGRGSWVYIYARGVAAESLLPAGRWAA